MGARQPARGLIGFVVVAAFSAVLGLAFNGPVSSLELIGPISTFALPTVVLIALWWDDLPGARFAGPVVGLVNLATVIVAGLVFAGVGLAVVGRFDPRGIFLADPGPTHLATYPATMVVAASAFVTFLQFTLVCDGWPFKHLGLGRFMAGVAAFVTSWIIAILIFFVLVNTSDLTVAEHHRIGLRNPGGPVFAGEVGAWMVAVTSWQLIVAVGMGGWPFNQIKRLGPRLAAANGFVLGFGTVWWALLRHGLGWNRPRLEALGGGLVAASLLMALLFEGWPVPDQKNARERWIRAASLAIVATVLSLAATMIGGAIHHWTTDSAAEWSTFVTLNYVAGGTVIYTVLAKRWPQGETPPDARAPAEAEQAPAPSTA